MDIPEPIDLLKEKLASLEKAINKSTVATYHKVSGNLNPWIEKYKHAIKLLKPIKQPHTSCGNYQDEIIEIIPWPCQHCNKEDKDYCMNICPMLK